MENISPSQFADFLESYMLKEAYGLLRSLEHESDRGCAIAMVSYVETQLGNLLKSRLVQNRKLIKELFDGKGALATFSSRIDMAFLLALVGDDIRKDLHLLRKIRNDFAHSPTPLVFENQKTRDRCLDLRYSTKNKDDPARNHFISASIGVLSQILISFLESEGLDPKTDFVPTNEDIESLYKNE